MKKLFLIFASFTLINCSTPSTANKKNPWVDFNESAEYISRNKRIPSSLSVYKTYGNCGDFPQVDVKTAPGFCLGQVDAGDGLSMPRMAIELPNGNLLLTDMGSWEPFTGKIYFYKKNGNKFERTLLFSRSILKESTDDKKLITDRPHHIALGFDGQVYVGTSSAIMSFDPNAKDPIATLKPLIKEIPNAGLHPLKSFAIDPETKTIFVNVGSATNVCQKFGIAGSKSQQCLETENLSSGQAQIRSYKYLGNQTFSSQFQVYAKGLRNSVALLWNPNTNSLMQMENGRDSINPNDISINAEFPHEEFNIISKGQHYGWPYCYDNNISNPEWNYINCKVYTPPQLLLPAHSAPLSMIIYTGNQFPSWYKNRILASFHGYEKYGHRLVTFYRDEKGLPTGSPLSIIYGWEKNGEQRMGSPVGVSQTKDGSVLIVEDLSKKLMILKYNSNFGDGKPISEITQIAPTTNTATNTDDEKLKFQLEEKIKDPNAPLITKIQYHLLDKHCIQCHGTDSAPGGFTIKPYSDKWNAKNIKEKNLATTIWKRISGDPSVPQMPPQGFTSETEQTELSNLVKLWIDQGLPEWE